MSLELQPITFAEASEFVRLHHRHHRPPRGQRFAIAVNNGGWVVVGVVMAGRPVARMNDDGYTAEVTRCCTNGHRNACSMLYRAAWRAAREMGFRRLITYTLPSEGGASLRGAGFMLLGERGGGAWSRAGRPRVDDHPTGTKLLWEVTA